MQVFKSLCKAINCLTTYMGPTSIIILTMHFASYKSFFRPKTYRSSVQWKSAKYIYLYVCIVFLYGTFMHVSTSNLVDSEQ